MGSAYQRVIPSFVSKCKDNQYYLALSTVLLYTSNTPTKPMDSTNQKIYQELVNITPAMARSLLEANTLPNRRIKPVARRKYERAIKAGEWKITHQGIALDANGGIIDGQHRLAAIANSGKTIQSYITYNLPADTFDVIDQGKARSFGDALEAGGWKKDSRTISTALLAYVRYQLYPEQPWGHNYTTPSPTEIVDWSNEKQGSINNFLPTLKELHKTARAFTVANALTHCLIGEDQGWRSEELLKFWETIATGANLEPTSLLLSYRNQLMTKAFKRRGSSTVQYQLNASIKCFNAWKEGKTGKFHAGKSIPVVSMVPRSEIITPKHAIMGIIRN